jgi:replication-associated recombination protein RarA
MDCLPGPNEADVPTGSIEPSDLFSVLWVHGPGGIGKSTLLAAYAETARGAGFTVAQVDGGRIRPTPAGIRAAVRHSPEVSQASTLRSSTVVIIDAAERLDAAEEWLREVYLPAMSAKTLVVIASRRPPGEPWRSDPGWRDLLRVVSLRNLLPEAVRALLDAERIPKELLGQVMA